MQYWRAVIVGKLASRVPVLLATRPQVEGGILKTHTLIVSLLLALVLALLVPLAIPASALLFTQWLDAVLFSLLAGQLADVAIGLHPFQQFVERHLTDLPFDDRAVKAR